uniref:DUF4283 domain-containing protein n=1 Tax=Cannabis sativa TaxID=3483 RepID=A0A803NHZ8_CANSA
MILCLPSVLQNDPIDSYTITPFWIQVYRLPFLSKSEALAKCLGNLIGTFIEVHENSLNEGWGPFLRMRVDIDVSKPLLRGIEPKLPYGPWIEDSSLPRSNYDRYRQEFSKAGPWPFITRLDRKSIAPIIPHTNQFPASPSQITNSEKGKEVLEIINNKNFANKLGSSMQHYYQTGSSSTSSHFDKHLTIGSPTTKSIAIPSAQPVLPSVLATDSKQVAFPTNKTMIDPPISTLPATAPVKHSVALPIATPLAYVHMPHNDTFSDGMSAATTVSSVAYGVDIFGQSSTPFGSTTNIQNTSDIASPLSNFTNNLLHQLPGPSSESAEHSRMADTSAAPLAKTDVQPRQSP